MRTLASYESTDHDEIARRIPVGHGHTVNRFVATPRRCLSSTWSIS